MMKVRDFAESVGCTPQNIYLHLENYSKELEGHISQGPRGKVLDEFACDFIRSVMNPKEISADVELQQQLAQVRSRLVELERENGELTKKLATAEMDKFLLNQNLEEHQRLLVESKEQEEQKAAELEEIVQACADLQEEHDKLKGDHQVLQNHYTALESEKSTLQNDLEKEKTRKLTWKERFTGRKDG